MYMILAVMQISGKLVVNCVDLYFFGGDDNSSRLLLLFLFFFCFFDWFHDLPVNKIVYNYCI